MNTLKKILENGINNAYSYYEYRQLISELLEKGKSTGTKQSESLTQYSMLNNKRMSRLDKTLYLTKVTQNELAALTDKKLWLVITEGWCGDAAHILPVMNKLAEASGTSITLKVILKDSHKELMRHFLTNGSESIPKLIVLDAFTKEVETTWGPRPSEATQMVNTYKNKYGSLDATFKKDLQLWYNKNKGQNIISDLLHITNLKNGKSM